MMGMNVDFLVWLLFGLAVVPSMILQNNIADASKPRRFYCHGDYCRMDEPIEFCSMTYKRCRPCSDIIDDCLLPHLPRNCSSTCIKHKVEEKIEELQENACPVLSYISHGKHNGSLTDTHKPGEVIMYTCDIGYRIIGASHRKCKRYGFWSDDIPTCKEIVCPRLSSVTNGMHNGSSDSLLLGTVVATSCAYGHQMYGENTTVCNSDGFWSNSLPVCIRNMCVQPHPIRNGRWLYSHHTSNWYVSGHILQAQCEQGYMMDGSSEWNCTVEGYWKSSEVPYIPSCFLQGNSAETCSCTAWQVGLGFVALLVFVGVFVIEQRRLCRKNQKDDYLVTEQEDIEKNIESVGIDDENIRLLDDRFMLIQEHQQTRRKVISSGAGDIPAPNSCYNQSKEPHVPNKKDTPEETRGSTTFVKIINNSNNNNGINNNNTGRNTVITGSAQQFTDSDSSINTQTAPPKKGENDKAPVEESGISCLSRQPEPPDDNLRNQPESSHGTLPCQLESPDGILPSQHEGCGCTLRSQSELSCGTLPSQPELSCGTLPSHSEPLGGTLQIQPESSSGTLPRQPELSCGTLPSHSEQHGGALQIQPESSSGTLPSQPELSCGTLTSHSEQPGGALQIQPESSSGTLPSRLEVSVTTPKG